MSYGQHPQHRGSGPVLHRGSLGRVGVRGLPLACVRGCLPRSQGGRGQEVQGSGRDDRDGLSQPHLEAVR